MIIAKLAVAGTMTSNDCLVTVAPAAKLTLSLESPVLAEFETRILQVVRQTLTELSVTAGLITIVDKGALDYTIAARLKTAVQRSV